MKSGKVYDSTTPDRDNASLKIHQDGGVKGTYDRLHDNNHIAITTRLRREVNFHDHDILVYPALQTFRKIYSQATKEALENNELAFLATTYDSFDRVIDSLKSAGVSVNNEARDGNLMILDAIRAYQIDFYGAWKFAKSLNMRASKNGKTGIFNISDLGSFFIANRISEMLEYEQSIPKRIDFAFKAICAYHKDDFSTLTKEQQEEVISCHNHSII